MMDAMAQNFLGYATLSFSDSLSALSGFALMIDSILDAQHMGKIQENRRDLIPILLALHGRLPNVPKLPESDLSALRQEFGYEVKVEDQSSGLHITIEDLNATKRLVSAMRQVSKYVKNRSLLYRSSLNTLTSTAEWFLSQVFTSHFRKYPGSAAIADRTLTFERIKSFNSIEEAGTFLLQQRTDELMRGSFDDWLGFLKKTLKLPMNYLLDEKDAVIEIFQRRNVFVHNNGVVNHQYLTVVAPEYRSDAAINKPLSISPEYLFRAIDLIEAYFVLIGAELWKKVEPADEVRGELLNHIAYESLKAERWSVAQKLSLFETEDFQLPERIRLGAQINYWQSLRWQGKSNEIRPVIEKADFSAKDELFQAARLCLLDENEECVKMLPGLIESGKLTVTQVRKWPLFKELRRTETYNRFCHEHEARFPGLVGGAEDEDDDPPFVL
jgi:hypothetical protein